MNAIGNRLLQGLSTAPGPMSASQLRDSLRRGGSRVEEFQVTEKLRELQRAGFVTLERRTNHWKIVGLPPGFNPESNFPATGVRPKVNKEGTQGTPSTHASSMPIAPPANHVGRWKTFRRLCHYYMDYLLQDEAPQLRGFVENQDDTWITVDAVPWERVAGRGDFAVPLKLAQASFQRNRARRGQEECIYLCYPVAFVRPKDVSGFVVPLFAQPMQADWRGGIIHLKPDGPIAVNGAWMRYHFRQRAEQEAFLTAMGFLTELDDDENQEDSVATAPKSFSSLAQDAARYIHDPTKYSEPIVPFQLESQAEWKETEPGLHNTAILTLGPRLRYTRSLLRDLRDISEKFSDEDLDATALAELFEHDAPSAQMPEEITTTEPKDQEIATEDNETSVTTEGINPLDGGTPRSTTYESPVFSRNHLAQTRLMHPMQRAAVGNAMSETVSVVTGPPGTGKSEVVAAMLINQLLRGCPTLFASKNHQALAAVIPRLNEVAESGELIVQTSSRELAERQDYLGKLQGLLSRPPRPDKDEGTRFQQRFLEVFDNYETALSVAKELEDTRNIYEEKNACIDDFRKNLPLDLRSDDAIDSWPEEISHGQLDSLEDELQKTFTKPKGLIQRLLFLVRKRSLRTRQLNALEKLTALPNPFKDRPIPVAGSDQDAWDNLFTTWRAWCDAFQLLVSLKACEKQIEQLPTSEECNLRLFRIQNHLERLTQEWLRWASSGLGTPLIAADRESLANLRAGIKNWGAARFARELRKHFPLILWTFPLWSVSNLSARSALPLAPGLFDLVIIDESSQCDIASVVPLLARSRRAVFAGDPMQLRHISRLDALVERSLLQQHGLTESNVQRFTYRVNSAFDLADSNSKLPDEARVRLNLHFRSHELIADYCNEAFYSKTLHIVTASDRLNVPKGMKPGIHWTQVDGKIERGTTGAWCADEIEAVQSQLAALEKQGYRGTIGVVTPFRQQANRLRDSLESEDSLSPEFRERTELLVDTAFGFQGGERDLILFSLCGGADLSVGGKLFFSKEPNQFNVAVSRARAVLHVVGNRDWALSAGIPYVEKLARRTLPRDPEAKISSTSPHQSPWETVLAQALKEAGIKAVPQYPIAGRFLDFAVLSPKKIDIEVDGEAYHRTSGGGRKDDDHWRDLQLQSLGWRICRFWVYELRENLPRCVEKVSKLMDA